MELIELFKKTSWNFSKKQLHFNLEDLTEKEWEDLYNTLEKMEVF